jgi:hypothetical protein
LLTADLVDRLLPARLLRRGALLGGGRLGRLVLDLTARFTIGVDVAAGAALHPTHFVFVLRDDRMRRVGLALRAVRLDVGADLVHIVFEDEVHGSSRSPGPVPKDL